MRLARSGRARRLRWWPRRREKYPRSAYLVLIERRAVCEPVAVETERGGARPRPTGFWRGERFHNIVRILERRSEWGASHLRVLADRGCYDLRHVITMDPWTWRAEGRWELTAELAAIPLKRLAP